MLAHFCKWNYPSIIDIYLYCDVYLAMAFVSFRQFLGLSLWSFFMNSFPYFGLFKLHVEIFFVCCILCIYIYSRTCFDRPALLHTESSLSRQVAYHQRSGYQNIFTWNVKKLVRKQLNSLYGHHTFECHPSKYFLCSYKFIFASSQCL